MRGIIFLNDERLFEQLCVYTHIVGNLKVPSLVVMMHSKGAYGVNMKTISHRDLYYSQT